VKSDIEGKKEQAKRNALLLRTGLRLGTNEKSSDKTRKTGMGEESQDFERG